jgi:hypothetical protein
MIGIIHKNHKIIAALPLRGGENELHMIVVGKSLPKIHGRHSATFVTWFTDGRGVFDSPILFTDHEATVEVLRTRAIGDMIKRAGHVLSPLGA